MANAGKRIKRGDGVIYDSINEAAREMQKDVHHTLVQPNVISRCARGHQITAYGHEWEFLDEKTSRSAVIMSRKSDFYVCGFDSVPMAIEYLHENGHADAYNVPIIRCCMGIQDEAYGAKWAWQDSDEPVEEEDEFEDD